MGLFSLLVVGGIFYGLTKLFSGDSGSSPDKKIDKNLEKYLKLVEKDLPQYKYYLTPAKREEVADGLIAYGNTALNFDCNKYRKQTLAVLKIVNDIWVKEKAKEYSLFFDNILDHSLDNQQRYAILREEDYHLVVAGAGAGKTLTIVGKVAFLCQKKGIKPEEILLISFTKKAAKEMTERLTKQLRTPVNAYTFHKLGLEIISKDKEVSPNIADENTLEKIINQYYRDATESTGKTASKLLYFLAYYLYIPADKQKFKSFGEFIEAERGTDLETLKSKYEKETGLPNKHSIYGERMKSQEEVMIANFLFLNGVKYEYERPYPHTPFSYRPDFYLPDYDIYLEHFGINKDGKCTWLPKIEAEKYEEKIYSKRQTHKNNGTKLIETYSYYQQEGILLDKLKEILQENGVKFNPISKKKVLKEIFMRDDRGLIEFNNLIVSFINLFKAQGYTFKDLDSFKNKLQENAYLNERTNLFLEIAKDIYKQYELALKKDNAIDFPDMISKATYIIKNGEYKFPYKYVIIDEYQDIGQDRYRLVKAILDNTKAKLICIGDDWQSIYRFAGSDISLFTSFDKYWGDTGYISRIEKTYRNSQDLINICGKFIMRNPAQIKKELISDKKLESPIKSVIYDQNNRIECLEKILDSIYDKFGKSTVFLLGRNNYDIEFLREAEDSNFDVRKTSSEVHIKYKKHPELDITFITAHKSKGLEADNVIIINCKNDYLGFPNKIADDPILQLLLSETDFYMYAEERRLMYVALTRTKNYTYLLMPAKNPSEFIMELNKIIYNPLNNLKTSITSTYTERKEVNTSETKKETYNCPRCKTGKLVKRIKNNEEFYGCSNYPKCNYTCKNPSKYTCPLCGGIMVLREGKFGKFYGCSNYPRCKHTFDLNPNKKKYNSYTRRRYYRKRFY